MLPVLVAVGAARCAPPLYYATTIMAIVPFVLIPVAFGCVVTLLLVNVFPARRARDVPDVDGPAIRGHHRDVAALHAA